MRHIRLPSLSGVSQRDRAKNRMPDISAEAPEPYRIDSRGASASAALAGVETAAASSAETLNNAR
jgi:hypothetical protein